MTTLGATAVRMAMTATSTARVPLEPVANPPLDPSSILVPSRTEQLIARRWLEWLPFVRIWLQRFSDDFDRIAMLQSEHRLHVLWLLRTLDIPMRGIRRHRLDDPRPDAWPARLDAIRDYLTRRSTSYAYRRQRRYSVASPSTITATAATATAATKEN